VYREEQMAYILVVQDIIGYFLVFHRLIARQQTINSMSTVSKEQINPRPIKDGAIKSRQKWVTNIVRKKKVARQIRWCSMHPKSPGFFWVVTVHRRVGIRR
jgi:hypothetical protein